MNSHYKRATNLGQMLACCKLNFGRIFVHAGSDFDGIFTYLMHFQKQIRKKFRISFNNKMILS